MSAVHRDIDTRASGQLAEAAHTKQHKQGYNEIWGQLFQQVNYCICLFVKYL
jgi:hypothetical protein